MLHFFSSVVFFVSFINELLTVVTIVSTITLIVVTLILIVNTILLYYNTILIIVVVNTNSCYKQILVANIKMYPKQKIFFCQHFVLHVTPCTQYSFIKNRGCSKVSQIRF